MIKINNDFFYEIKLVFYKKLKQQNPIKFKIKLIQQQFYANVDTHGYFFCSYSQYFLHTHYVALIFSSISYKNSIQMLSKHLKDFFISLHTFSSL